jgi:hypothetical protein
MAPTFITVGGVSQACTYGALNGEFQFFDNLQFFDAAGDVNFTAVWLDENVGATPGWYDNNDWGVALADEPLPSGSAFFVSMAAGGSIVISGEVDMDPVQITGVEGFTAMGNPRPYDVTYGDLVCTGVQFFDNLQFFDAAGDVIFTAVWLDENVGATPGWYDNNDWGVALAGEAIVAGQGFFLSCAAAGATVTIPAPVL